MKPTRFKNKICFWLAKLALIAIPWTASTSFADPLPMGWTSVRALGMGNAYVSVVDNEDSLFYNPAGLARVSGVNWTVFDIGAGLNGPEALEAAMQLQKIKDEMASTINNLYGKKVWIGAGGKTAVTVPYFGAAGFATGEAGYFQQNPANPRLNLNYYFDYGVAFGSAIDFVPGILSVGLTARRVNRTGTTSILGPGSLATLDGASFESELKRRGTGYGVDFGATLRIPGPVSPAFSFVYRNLGDTAFSHDEGAGAPPSIKGEMIVGASMQISGPLITITPAFDYRYMNYAKVGTGKNINLGVEIDLPLIDLRAGLHQGYYTLGAGVSLGILRADVATWGVELGEYAGQHEDRRYMAQITFELGFDPGRFGFGSSSSSGGANKSGERRRLKQRR